MKSSRVILILLPLALAGCRFGNYRKEQPQPKPSYTLEFFETNPERLTLCAATTQKDEVTCADTNPNPVPGLLAQFMGNPLGIQIRNSSVAGVQVATLFDPYYPSDQKPGFPMELEAATGRLGFSGYENPSPLLDDPKCTSQFFLTADGQIIRETPRETSELTLSGRVTMNFQLYSTYDGECEKTLSLLHACYFDANQCDRGSAAENEKLQTAIQNMFEPYITGGVMTAEDIPYVIGIGYQVSYE